MSRVMHLLLLLVIPALPAQTPPLLMNAGQQQFVTAPGNCGVALNAYSSSDPLVVSVQQMNQSIYRFEALKGGTAYITLNCNGHISTSLLTVQSAEYQTFVCPSELASTYAVPEGWTVTQKQRRVFAFTRATLEANTLSCHYGAGDDLLLTRILRGRCSLSPNKKGAYCQPE